MMRRNFRSKPPNGSMYVGHSTGSINVGDESPILESAEQRNLHCSTRLVQLFAICKTCRPGRSSLFCFFITGGNQLEEQKKRQKIMRAKDLHLYILAPFCGTRRSDKLRGSRGVFYGYQSDGWGVSHDKPRIRYLPKDSKAPTTIIHTRLQLLTTPSLHRKDLIDFSDPSTAPQKTTLRPRIASIYIFTASFIALSASAHSLLDHGEPPRYRRRL